MIWLFFNNCEEKRDPMIQYLSGYNPSFALVVYDTISKKRCMFTAGFEVSMYKKIKTFTFSEKKIRSDISKFFKLRSINTMGANFSFLSIKEARYFKKVLKVRLIDISKDAIKIRLHKSKQELEYIKKACKLTDALFVDLLHNAKRRKFTTEKDISLFMQNWATNHGVTHSFEPIVATSKNAAIPHHHANNTRLSGFTVLDFGIKYSGYCSDMTRTIYFGRPSIQDKIIYEDLLNLQLKCIEEVIVGVKASKLDNIARQRLGKYFVHSLGHGLGVQIHESPNISPKSKTKISNNMVITIEPGIYKQGRYPYGIRIEDTLAIINNKKEVLTKSIKELISI